MRDERADEAADDADADRASADDKPLGLGLGGGGYACYVCFDADATTDANPLIAPCSCKGSTRYARARRPAFEAARG